MVQVEIPRPPRVALAIDRPGWAFDHIAQRLVKGLSMTEPRPPAEPEPKPLFSFTITPYLELANQTGDLLVCFWWRELERLRNENLFHRAALCLYDHWSWSATRPDMYDFAQALNHTDALLVANQELEGMVRCRLPVLLQHGLKQLPPIFLVEDGVDCELFDNTSPPPPRLTVGWCGNARAARGTIKGLDLIQEACDRDPEVDLNVMDVSAGQGIPHSEMPSFYLGLSAYICASSKEGTPNPVLEAMACGRPVITTRCGITPRVVQHGHSGWFVQRSSEAIYQAIQQLKVHQWSNLSRAARRSAVANDWVHRMPAWKAALEGALDRWP